MNPKSPEEMSIEELDQLLLQEAAAVDAAKERVRSLRQLRDQRVAEEKIAAMPEAERNALARVLGAQSIPSGEKVQGFGGR